MPETTWTAVPILPSLPGVLSSLEHFFSTFLQPFLHPAFFHVSVVPDCKRLWPFLLCNNYSRMIALLTPNWCLHASFQTEDLLLMFQMSLQYGTDFIKHFPVLSSFKETLSLYLRHLHSGPSIERIASFSTVMRLATLLVTGGCKTSF